MSTLQVANVHFNTGGTSRFDVPLANVVRLVVNSANVAYATATTLQVNAPLTVNGDISISGNATISGAAAVSGDMTVAGNVTISGTSTGVSGRLLRAPQIITTTGAGTYTTPAGCNSIYVELVGGGNSGAAGESGTGGGGGGGAGAYAAKYFSVSPNTGYSIVVGAAGIGTTITVGGTTVTAGAGAAAATSSGGVGGTATNGDINISGGDGGGSATTTSGVGGLGGASYFGGGGAGGSNGNGNPGSAANAYGAGGGGGGYKSSGQNLGGAGKQGVIRIWEYT